MAAEDVASVAGRVNVHRLEAGGAENHMEHLGGLLLGVGAGEQKRPRLASVQAACVPIGGPPRAEWLRRGAADALEGPAQSPNKGVLGFRGLGFRG